MNNYFTDKKITIMGLGLLGRGVGDAKFLAEQGADLVVTDLRSEDELKESLVQLQGFSNITFVLGEHREIDFIDRDIVIHAAGIRQDDRFLAVAKESSSTVTQSVALYCQLLREKYPRVKIIGVTGTRGKSTVSTLIHHGLICAEHKAFLGGNVRGLSTLSHLLEATADEYQVLELDAWQLQAFAVAGISPQYAVFTNFMIDHMDYYHGDSEAYLRDKAAIFSHQKPGDVAIMTRDVHHLVKDVIQKNVKIKMLEELELEVQPWRKEIVTSENLKGIHNYLNAQLAILVWQELGLSEAAISAALQSYELPEGRMSLVNTVDGVRYWNNTNATTPEAFAAGLDMFPVHKLHIIMGGHDKDINLDPMITAIHDHADRIQSLVLLPGSGTERFKKHLPELSLPFVWSAKDLSAAISIIQQRTQADDEVILNPGFASFGLFKNEYDRGDTYKELVMLQQ